MINKIISHIGVAILQLLSYLPLRVLYLIADILYFIIYRVVKYRIKVVRKNLKNSFPEKSQQELTRIEKDFYRQFADMMVEVVKSSSISEKELLKRVTFKNITVLEEHFAKGESTLGTISHYGNWEMVMLALSLNPHLKIHGIYKPINNKPFEKWYNRMRTRFGTYTIPMRQTARSIVANKDKCTHLIFASDQSPRIEDTTHQTYFLNQKTYVLVGLEKIARQTNRPVYYLDVKRIKRGYYELECLSLCEQPKDTKENEITNRYFEMLTTIIHREPCLWLWSHNRWKRS